MRKSILTVTSFLAAASMLLLGVAPLVQAVAAKSYVKIILKWKLPGGSFVRPTAFYQDKPAWF